MFTGFYNNKSERFENLIYNITALSFIVMFFLKLVGWTTLSWVIVFAPLALPICIATFVLVSFRVAQFIYVQLDRINIFK